MDDSNSHDNSGLAATTVPEVALRWILLHATTSNVELAHLSNICRSCRDVVTTVILEQATYKTIPSGSQLLLLPSMASQMMRGNNNNANNNTTTTNNNVNGSKTADDTKATTTPAATTGTTISSVSTAEETFCAAWFAPEGVQLLDLDDEQVDSDHEQYLKGRTNNSSSDDDNE